MSSTEHPLPANPWDRIRTAAGGPGAETHLATVGTWLFQDGVRSADLPGGRLLSYLARFPEYCRVEGPPTRQVVRFGDGPAPPPPMQSHATDSAQPTGELALRHDLWQAMVADHAARAWFLDVGTLRVVSADLIDDQPGPPVQGEEWHFLRVPTLSSLEQRQQARDVLADALGEMEADTICADHGWLRRVNEDLDPAVRDRVLSARRRWVVQRATEWLEAHGQPVRTLVHRQRTPSTELPKGSPSTTALRQAVHRAVDRMTAEELATLLVPAHLLVE